MLSPYGRHRPWRIGRPLERCEELVGQAALADARLAVDRDEVRAAVSLGSRERVLEQVELVVPADERRHRHATCGACAGGGRGPDPDRVLAAAHLDGPDVLDLDAAEGEAVRCGADQDLAGLGELLQTGREVESLAGGERGVARAGHDLAGLDPDPGLKLEVAHRVEDLERGANRALGVVLVRLRHAECGHDRVAGEFLDGAAVRLDTAGHLVEESRHAPAHDLGVARGDERRRVDEVDEQDRGKFAFHTSKCRNEPGGRSLPERSGLLAALVSL